MRTRPTLIQLAMIIPCLGWPTLASAAPVNVTSAAGLISAVSKAMPGDVITLAPGTYKLTKVIKCMATGKPNARIVIRAAKLGTVTISSSATAAFKVFAPRWTFENLDIVGTCSSHSACEHAIHIVGKADFTLVRGCRLREYNAQIKGNGDKVWPGGKMRWPNDVVIEYCEMFNKSVRNTGNPVTPVDVVGGRRWRVRGNFIHDHAKSGNDKVSFAAFFKGNSQDGVFERNLVACEWLHKGTNRVGLSLGGGGTWPATVCENGTCAVEHTNGILRNNVIVNCPADVGIYINEGKNTRIYNNTLYNTSGIDVRFKASFADIRNNLLSGQIRKRDGAKTTQGSNMQWVSKSSWGAWFKNPSKADFSLKNGASLVDKGTKLKEVADDFCKNDRDDGKYDIGAVEYDGDRVCVTTTPFTGPPITKSVDAGPPVPDQGGGGYRR